MFFMMPSLMRGQYLAIGFLDECDLKIVICHFWRLLLCIRSFISTEASLRSWINFEPCD